jgi:hypothetical protein
MVRRLLVGVMAAGLLLVGAPAFAQPPVNTTNVQKNLVETFVDVVPSCEEGGALYTITTTSNLVEHETAFDDGRVHATFTQTGTFVAVPLEDPSLPSYTGKFTTWGGFNESNNVVNGPHPLGHGGGDGVGEPVGHIAQLPQLAALNDGVVEHVGDRTAQRLGAVQHHQQRPGRVESTVA